MKHSIKILFLSIALFLGFSTSALANSVAVDSLGNNEVVTVSENTTAVDSNSEKLDIAETTSAFLKDTCFYRIGEYWRVLLMLVVACFLIYLAIVKKYDHLLFLPIEFGMLLTIFPERGLFHAML